MPTSRYAVRITFAIAAPALMAAVLGAASPDASTSGAPTATASQAGQQPPAAGVSPADYAGEDACVSCHDTKSYKGAHAQKDNPRTPASTHGCESCHGAGKNHVDSGGDTSKIVNPGSLTPQAAAETCTACHDRAKHALSGGNQHDQRNVGCTGCHSIHAAAGPKLLKARSRDGAVRHLRQARHQL